MSEDDPYRAAGRLVLCFGLGILCAWHLSETQNALAAADLVVAGLIAWHWRRR